MFKTRIPRRMFLQGATATAALAACGEGMEPLGVSMDGSVDSLASGLTDVNDQDILASIRLGCQTMQSVFNPEDSYRPWFGHFVVPYDVNQSRFEFNPHHHESHVPGRHLWGLLEARSIGVAVSDTSIARHRAAAYFSLGRPIPLPQNRPTLSNTLPRIFLPHNIREGVHALYALYLHSPADAVEARNRMESLIGAIRQFWVPTRTWNLTAMRSVQSDIELVEWGGPFVSGVARAIGPLAKYWHTSRSRGQESLAARDLLQVLVARAREAFLASGVGVDHGGHSHSISCTLSGLAQYAELTGDTELMSRVFAHYQVSLNEQRDELGWAMENLGVLTDRGESNNSGDILETALILGRHGYPRCFADADRILRCHLLPSQLVDVSFIYSPAFPANDSVRDVDLRSKGAFGFPAPYGHRAQGYTPVSFNMDIVGGATASLVEAWRQRVRRSGTTTTVQTLFDATTSEATVVSPYNSTNFGVLQVTVHQAGTLRIPLPETVLPRDVVVEGATSAPTFEADGTLVLGNVQVNQVITVRLTLPEREIDLGHRNHSIRVRVRGNKVISMENFGTGLNFFPAIPSTTLARTSLGQVARWSATGSGLIVPDDSGLGHPLSLRGSARLDATLGGPPGKTASALVLDGNGFAGAGIPSLLNFGKGSFTLALWMRTSMAEIGRLISRGSYGWTPGYFLSVGHGGAGRIGFGLGAGSLAGAASSVEMFTRLGGFNNNVWRHVAAVVDRTAGVITLYVDGVAQQVDKTAGTAGTVITNGLQLPAGSPASGSSTYGLTLGCHSGWGELFRGGLADVRIFDRALTATEVGAIR
jgi:hypothetical protein